MNVKFWVIMLFFLSAMTSGLAQNNRRDVLLDSMVNVVFDGIQRADMIEMNNMMLKTLSKDERTLEDFDPFLLESLLFSVLKESLFPYVRSSFVEFTEEELCEAIRFVSSDAYKRYSTIDFKERILPFLESDIRKCFSNSFLNSVSS